MLLRGGGVFSPPLRNSDRPVPEDRSVVADCPRDPFRRLVQRYHQLDLKPVHQHILTGAMFPCIALIASVTPLARASRTGTMTGRSPSGGWPRSTASNRPRTGGGNRARRPVDPSFRSSRGSGRPGRLREGWAPGWRAQTMHRTHVRRPGWHATGSSRGQEDQCRKRPVRQDPVFDHVQRGRNFIRIHVAVPAGVGAPGCVEKTDPLCDAQFQRAANARDKAPRVSQGWPGASGFQKGDMTPGRVERMRMRRLGIESIPVCR